MAYTDNFAATITGFVDSLTSADKMELNNMLYDKSFETSDLATKHNIVTGVRNGNLVPILRDTPNPDSFAFVDENTCVDTEVDVAHEFSNKRWDLGLIEGRLPICLRSFNEDFLKFFNVYKHAHTGDPNLDDALLSFITDKFSKNLLLSTWRAAWFSDTASASPFYNQIDGLFTQGEANANQVINITENAGATFAAQSILTGEAVYNYYISMYEKASEFPWFDDSIMEFRSTKSMTIKLVAYLNRLGKNAPGNCGCMDPKSMTERNTFMIDGLTINGIPVITHHEFDNIINYSAVLNGGGGNNARVNPHRAMLTVKDNLLIGTSQTEALQSFRIWHSEDDNMVYVKGSSYLGGSIPLDEYVLAI